MTKALLKKVLIIAYYFPPLGLSGVQRTAKFAKYLPEFGWSPTVLTVHPPGYFAFDESMLREVEAAGVEIVRTNSLDPNRMFGKSKQLSLPSERRRKALQFISDFFFIPDNKIGWKQKALTKAMELHTQKDFDVIFATSPPQTDLLIGLELKERFNIPLVVDYRDSWYKYPFKYLPTPWHRRRHLKLEKRVLQEANHIITVNRYIKEIIVSSFPGNNYDEVTIIPPGFDPEDYTGIRIARKSKNERFTITHAGLFYVNRSPLHILQAIKALKEKNPEVGNAILFRHIGAARKEDLKLVQQLGLQDSVEFTGYLEHRECVKRLTESDLLYLPIGEDYSSPGKLYEYFGARRPILASLVDGYMKQLLKESGNAVTVPFGDAAAHEQAILDLYSRWKKGKLILTPEEFVNKFNRRNLAGDLARILEHQLFLDPKSSLVIK